MPDLESLHQGKFGKTSWTLILALRAGDQQRSAALEELCGHYRLPLYHFARRCGLNSQDSDDVVQDFLSTMIRRDTFSKADQTKGRLRTFLLSGLRQQIADWHRRQKAQKRGGAHETISIEELVATNHGHEPLDERSPDKLFARKWAQTVCDQVLQEIRRKWSRNGKAAWFDALSPFLMDSLENTRKEQLADELGISASNLGVTLHRLRREFGVTVRKHVADTVASASEVDDELREIGLSFAT